MRWYQHWFERTIAAIWFAVAACMYLLASVYLSFEWWPLGRLYWTLVTILSWAISGYMVGWGIVCVDRVWMLAQSVARSFGVIIVSYLFFGIGLFVWNILYEPLYYQSLRGYFEVLSFNAVLLFIAPLFIPWDFVSMFVAGIGAGILLYCLRHRLRLVRTISPLT